MDVSNFVGFFTGWEAQELIVFLTVGLVGFIQGFYPGLSLFRVVKMKLNLEDLQAHYAIQFLSLLIAAFALWVTGAIDFGTMEFTLNNLMALWLAVYSPSQLAFQKFRDDNLKGAERNSRG